jgi:tetratricopeptide (TPR) repeat protein
LSAQSLELALQVANANALLPLKGYAASETVAALNAAKRLLDVGVGTDTQRFSVLFGLCVAVYSGGQMEPALALSQELVEIADRQDDPIYRLVAHRLQSTLLVLTGQHREALKTLRQAEGYRDLSRTKLLSYRFGVDAGLAVLNYQAWALMFLALIDEAAQIREKVLSELPGHGHAPSIAMCSCLVVVLPDLLFGDLETCERQSAELVAYCTEQKVVQWRLWGALCHSCARATREPSYENIAMLRAAIDAQHRTGVRVMDSCFISHLAEALLMAGNVTEAEAVLRGGFAYAEKSAERFWLADLHRVDGRIALIRPSSDRARAEACFLHAIEIAHQQEARILELRAATDLARMWRDAGSSNDLHVLLEPILATIEGGETTRDVRNARALLVEIE